MLRGITANVRGVDGADAILSNTTRMGAPQDSRDGMSYWKQHEAQKGVLANYRIDYDFSKK